MNGSFSEIRPVRIGAYVDSEATIALDISAQLRQKVGVVVVVGPFIKTKQRNKNFPRFFCFSPKPQKHFSSDFWQRRNEIDRILVSSRQNYFLIHFLTLLKLVQQNFSKGILLKNDPAQIDLNLILSQLEGLFVQLLATPDVT